MLDFSGRSRRLEYWLFAVTYCAIQIVLVGIFDAAGGKSGGPAADILGTVQVLVAFLLIVPGLSVSVRRLHDTNRSGKWLLLLIAPPIVWMFFLFSGLYHTLIYQIFMTAYLASAIVFLIFTLLPGATGSNDYGPDPKALT